MKNLWFYDSPIGKLGIVEEDGRLIQVVFGDKGCPQDLNVLETPLIARAGQQLFEYFGQRRKEFDLPFRLTGTDFQKSCWYAVSKIPYGETRTYREVALSLGKPKAVRAMGSANGKNPLPIIVPCHRVIGSDGSLTGYGGGLEAKRYLLNLERGQAI